VKSVDELVDNNAEASGPGGPSPLPGLLEPDQYDGDLDDVIVGPDSSEEWARGAAQPQYGDVIVRREHESSPWEPVSSEVPRGRGGRDDT